MLVAPVGVVPFVPPASAAGDPVDVSVETPVTAVDLRIGAANNSPTVSADPTSPQFLALASRVDAPDFSCKLHLSDDGGETWVPTNPVPKLPAGAEKCYAPEVDFDRGGVLHYLFMGLAGAGSSPMGAFLTTSSDHGRTFSMPRRVLGPRNYQVRMAVDRTRGAGGRVHFVWLHASSAPPTGGLPPSDNPILAAYSDDGGRTLSRPTRVSDRSRVRVVAPSLAVGQGNAIHVMYYDLGDDIVDYQGLEGPTWEGTWSVVAAASFDGGKTFGAGAVVDDEVVPPERVMLIYTMAPPTLATGPDDSLYGAWTDARHGDADVFLRRSDDGGRRWGAAVRVNDDPIGNGRRQHLPHLSVSPKGRVDVVFYDRRGDPHDVHTNVSYAFSTNRGSRFSRNVTLTSERSDSLVGARYAVPSATGMVEFGSRLALVSNESTAVAAWTDTRNSFSRGHAKGGPTAQDIFSARLTLDLPDRSRSRTPSALLVAGATVLLFTGVVALRRRRQRADPARAAPAGPR